MARDCRAPSRTDVERVSKPKLPMAKIDDGRPFRRSGVPELPIRWHRVAIITALAMLAVIGAWMWAWHQILQR